MGAGVWGFEGKEDNFQEDGKSTCLINKYLTCYAETMEHREESEQTGSANLALAYCIYLIHFVVISGDSSLPGPVPLPKFF